MPQPKHTHIKKKLHQLDQTHIDIHLPIGDRHTFVKWCMGCDLRPHTKMRLLQTISLLVDEISLPHCRLPPTSNAWIVEDYEQWLEDRSHMTKIHKPKYKQHTKQNNSKKKR